MQWVNATRDYASALFGIRRAVGLAPARDADVDGACFAGCNLEGADFERARNIERADFTGSNWRRAKFDPHIAAMLAARYPETDEREEDVAQAKKVTTGAENATATRVSEQPEDDAERDTRVKRLTNRWRRARTVERLCRSFTTSVEELAHSGCNQVFLLEHSEDGGARLRLRAEWVDSDRSPSARVYDVASDQSVIASVARTAQVFLVADARNLVDVVMVKPTTRSGLTLPILHPDRHSVLGVVNIEHQQVEAFSESTVEAMRRLVTALAAHLVRLTEPPDATQQTPT